MEVIVALKNIQALSSGSTWDSEESNSSSREGSGDEELIEIDGDDGIFPNGTWRFMGADYSTNKVLVCYPFSPLRVAGHPTFVSLPNPSLFLDELIQVIVVDTNQC